VVCPLSVGSDRDSHHQDVDERPYKRPPGKVRKAAVNGRYDGADERNDPGELLPVLASQPYTPDAAHNTDQADGDGRQCERVANDSTEAK
jgi:hypothetical protein